MDASDDYHIAMAWLHGAEITYCAVDPVGWYVNNHNNADPVARRQKATTGTFRFASRAAAARAYCEFHQLI